MLSKCTILLVFFATIFLTTYVPSEALNVARSPTKFNARNNLIAGSRLPGDHLAYQGYVIKSYVPGGIVSVEKTFNATQGERITQVVAWDQMANGKGGYAYIVKGGPGLRNVTINFKSQRNYAISFLVQVYSRR